MDLRVGEFESHVAEAVGPSEFVGALDRVRGDVEPERAARLRCPRGLTGRMPGPAADVENLVVEPDAAGLAQHRVVSPQFGVIVHRVEHRVRA